MPGQKSISEQFYFITIILGTVSIRTVHVVNDEIDWLHRSECHEGLCVNILIYLLLIVWYLLPVMTILCLGY